MPEEVIEINEEDLELEPPISFRTEDELIKFIRERHIAKGFGKSGLKIRLKGKRRHGIY